MDVDADNVWFSSGTSCIAREEAFMAARVDKHF